MRERELAELLFRIAADRGVDVETAADELATSVLPSFVDAQAFRSAVIQTLEASLRAQVEERLQSIRRKFEMPGATAPTPPSPTPFAAAPTPAKPVITPPAAPAPAMDGLGDAADATLTDFGTVAEAVPDEHATVVSEELPADATMVWTTRHG